MSHAASWPHSLLHAGVGWPRAPLLRSGGSAWDGLVFCRTFHAPAATGPAAVRGPPSPPAASLPLPPPAGAPYDPRYYVHRHEEEKRALAKLELAGTPVVLWGPEDFGKRSMVGYLLDRVREEDRSRGAGPLVIDADLGVLLPDPPTPEALMERFARFLLRQARAGDAAFDALAKRRQDWAFELQDLMEDHVFPAAWGGRVVLVLKRADALWGTTGTQGPFYRALRIWSERSAEAVWSRLRMILMLSATPTIAFDDPEHIDSPFANLTADVIELGDISPDQVADLAALHGLPWGRDVVDRDLYPLVGGHPYLLRVIMHRARASRTRLSPCSSAVTTPETGSSGPTSANSDASWSETPSSTRPSSASSTIHGAAWTRTATSASAGRAS